jgi:hypothetical protein
VTVVETGREARHHRATGQSRWDDLASYGQGADPTGGGKAIGVLGMYEVIDAVTAKKLTRGGKR